MTKITNVLSLLALTATFQAYAEPVDLKDNSKILGKWHVDAAAPSLDREKRAQDSVWEINNNGTIVISGKDVVSSRTGLMNITLKYSIEDGKIKRQKAPGREKYENCTVFELDDKNMTLKCTYLFYFLSKM